MKDLPNRKVTFIIIHHRKNQIESTDMSSLLCLIISLFFMMMTWELSNGNCLVRGRNCSACLSDGMCGFCDSCGDHCHRPGTLHWLENCTDCASCMPGTLAGPQKGFECRREWYYYEKCPEVVSEHKTVYVGIALYLMNLHSVDLKSGTFHADFYLYFKVPPGQTMYTKQKCKGGLNGVCFELVNAAGVAEVSSHEGKYFRVKSKFNFAADLANFPFDNQTLKIEIQDMEMTAKELRWKLLTSSAEDDRPFKFHSGIAPTLNYTGWVFDTYSWSQIIYERYNPFLDQGVSRYAFMIHMNRPRRAAFFKIFLPPLFAVLVICFAFAIPPKDATMRVWIDGNLLISCVMFHATTSEQTPDIQELTLADKFMVGVYSFIFVSFMVSIILLKLQREKMYNAAETFYQYAEGVVWCTAPTYFMLLYYMRMALTTVLLIVSLVAVGIIALIYIYRAIRCQCVPPSHKFREMATMTTNEVSSIKAKMLGYQQIMQQGDEENDAKNNLKHRPVPKPCFPGTPKAAGEDPCSKQANLPNRHA